MSKGEETKRNIVEQAAAVFNRLGYEGASLSHLMEATGLQKGGIYRHFASKEELAAEAFDYAWESTRSLRMKGIDPSAGAIEQLKQTITSFVNRRPPVPGGCPLLNTAVDSDDGNTVLRARVRQALADWKAHVAAVVDRGIRDGQIRQGVDASKAAAFLVGALEGGVMMSRLEGNNNSLRAIEGYLLEFVGSLSV